MAIRSIIKDGVGVPSVPSLPKLDKDGKLSAGGLASLNAAVLALYEKLDGGLSLGSGAPSAQAGNLDGQWIRINVVAGAVEHEIAHGLKRLAVGFLVVYKDGPVDVYASSTRSWGVDTLFVTTVLAAGTATVKIVPV